METRGSLARLIAVVVLALLAVGAGGALAAPIRTCVTPLAGPAEIDCGEHQTRQGEGIWGGHTPKERVKIRRKWSEQVRRAS